MTAMLGQSPVVKVKPQPDIYTLLLILAIVFLAVTVGIVMYNLMTAYDMTFVELFTGREIASV